MSVNLNPAKAALYEQIVDALNTLFGVHPGFRAAHAKGIVCEGSFTPAAGATSISRAAHLQGASVPVTCRFSNSTGVPNIPDGDPNANPRGLAIRFHAPGAGETDIVSHSANGFPVSTAEEFLAFLRAVAESGPDARHPNAIEKFVVSHPNALRFVQLPKPTPVSFGSESYFGVHAFRFINREQRSQFGRYFIRPLAGEQHLDATEAASKHPDFLFKELPQRLSKAPIQFRLNLQIPNPGDPTNDASINWPDDRKQVELGILNIKSVAADSDAAQRRLIFDPTRLIDGIELGDDPLPQDRAETYSVSYSRRNPG
jgi:catalase